MLFSDKAAKSMGMPVLQWVGFVISAENSLMFVTPYYSLAKNLEKP